MPDLKQSPTNVLSVVSHQLTLANTSSEYHHLFELCIDRTVDAQISEVTCQPPDQFGVEHV